MFTTYLDFHINHVVLGGILGVFQYFVQKDGLDLQVRELTDVTAAEDGLLGVQVAEDVHTCLLHHRKQLGVVLE